MNTVLLIKAVVTALILLFGAIVDIAYVKTAKADRNHYISVHAFVFLFVVLVNLFLIYLINCLWT